LGNECAYENLPLFSFNCGLIGHGEGLCEVEGLRVNFNGCKINPKGAWLRATVYSRRVVDNKDLFFGSNHMKSLSGAN
jgi:hypothetical protein